MHTSTGEQLYSMDLGKNDPIHSRHKNINLTVSRTNRRKSIEDNMLMPNVKFVSPHSRTHAHKGLDPGSKTDRLLGNDTYNSRLQTEDDSNMIDESKYMTQDYDRYRMSANASAMSPGLGQNSGKLLKNSSGIMNPMHNRASNRSFDNTFKRHRYSPSENNYKKYVGDIGQIQKTQPGKQNIKPSESSIHCYSNIDLYCY